jgi:hypothetical protein
MSNGEIKLWKEVFPHGMELYYDGKTPDQFARWMLASYGLPVKRVNGSMCRFGIPVQLFKPVVEAWRGEIGSYN